MSEAGANQIRGKSMNPNENDKSESQGADNEPRPSARVDDVNAKHFETDHLLANLRGRTVASGLVTVVSQGIQFFLTLVSTMILARLLEPKDFGLLAMVWTIMGFLRIFKDAGLSTATVQREGINHTQVSNLFWVNVVVSGFISVLVAASAPFVAWFYHEPRLVGVTLALSPVFLLAGMAVQHMALMNRQMRFRTIAQIQVVSVVAGVLVGTGMAWYNCGYWSLVGMNLTSSLVALLMTWSASTWRPQFFRSRSGTRSLLHFGANLTAGTFIYSVARGLDSLLIGRFCGAVPLGLYSRASAMLARPMEQLIAPIEAVVIPSLSRLQTQPKAYRQSFIKLYESIILASFFLTGMFFALAHPFTLVVLGPKWEKATVIVAALSFAALQAPLGSCASWLIISQGRGKDSLSAGWIVSIVIASSFIAGLPFGPAGVAIAYSASCLLVQTPIYNWIVGRKGPVSTNDLWIGFFKHLPVWGVVTLTAWLMLKACSNFSSLAQLAICIPISFLAGVAFIFVYSPSRCIAVNLLVILREFKNPVQAGKEEMDDEINADISSVNVCVSVIIPTYNREAFIVKAVNSVLSQTFKDFEIIVVDDGSTDGTRSALEAYAGRIKYVYQNNAGVSAARNAGIARASGKWITFLDSDDEWAQNFLARQMQVLSENKDICMQIADCRYIDQTGEKVSYFEANGALEKFNQAHYIRPKKPFAFLLHHLSWQVGSVVIRKDAVKRAGPFDINFNLGEDQEFLARVALQGPVGLLKDKLVIVYRRSEAIENLSRITKVNPIASRKLQDGIYSKLGSLSALPRTERRTAKWLRGANYRAIGNLLLAEGKLHEARSAYWMSVKIHPSIASIGRYILSYLRKHTAAPCPMTLDATQTADK